jgi:hypothetical protein
MTTVKINVDKVSLKVFFQTMANMSDHMNETSFQVVHSITKRRLQIQAQAQAAEFYTPNQFSDTIILKKGCPWMHHWPDHDLVNTKQGWESLGVINENLLLGDHYDYAQAGHAYPIPQTMAGLEIEVDPVELQEWYRAFTTFPSQVISDAQ